LFELPVQAEQIKPAPARTGKTGSRCDRTGCLCQNPPETTTGLRASHT
jgi:hypothetical protein